MTIVDANIFLRYLLQDDPDLFQTAQSFIEKKEIFIPNEIIAEVVYVLEKVYKVERKDIREAWDKLLLYQNLNFVNESILMIALKQYVESRIDFVDALLVGYSETGQYEIETFDKKLKNKLQKKL
jgi:predicted nucleic-acid-binding protein